MLHRNFNGALGSLDPTAREMLDKITAIGEKVPQLYLDRNYAQAVRDIVAMADEANKYLQDAAPWKTVKENKSLGHQQLTTALHVGKACLALLKPILPQVASQTETMLHLENGFLSRTPSRSLLRVPLLGNTHDFFERIDPKKGPKDGGRVCRAKAARKKRKNLSNLSPLKKSTLKHSFKQTFGSLRFWWWKTFQRQTNLYRLELDVGPLGQKQVFAGLKNHVSKDDLLNKMVVLVSQPETKENAFWHERRYDSRCW